MEFRFETNYDQKAMTAMARALRKTIRAKRATRSIVYGIIVVLLGILLMFSSDDFGTRQIITCAALIAIVVVLFFQDQLNGYIAAKRSLPGLNRAITTFRKDGYHSVTPVGESVFPYSNILMLAEDEYYFIFIFGASHAQLYDKRGFSGGSIEEFKSFIKDITQLDWIKVA